ncbi:exported hypothetical protein [Candidatus Desulfosporosinus infrequens]|uniref:Uncharacterized protein n=1 Tax=Candidatus Desulfosporosinus infrequens TaxID=2043169 RepID=A0A2U3KAB8_9FIRM|nr:exported hypothetical protein [Candidatus Desulfosporosinus infrequens]
MIGWRITKTGIAVALCIWIAQLLNSKSLGFSTSSQGNSKGLFKINKRDIF